MKVLDVGCGNNPRGHINVDVFTDASFHRSSDWRPIDTSGIVFIKASGEYLPFKNNVFDMVFSSNVMEHVKHPLRFLRECYRVCKAIVKVIVPHRFARVSLKLHQGRAHINFFNVTYFRKLLRGYAYDVECSFEPKPHKMLPLFMMPYMITVIVYKNGEN